MASSGEINVVRDEICFDQDRNDLKSRHLNALNGRILFGN